MVASGMEWAKVLGTLLGTGAAAYAARRAASGSKKTDDVREALAKLDGRIDEMQVAFGRFADATDRKFERVNDRLVWLDGGDIEETPQPTTPAPSSPLVKLK